MIKNYLKVAFRHLGRHRQYSIINIAGLATGITCCILIMLFVRSEWSYDRFHSKANRIHRAWLQESYKGEIFTNTVTPVALGPVLKSNLAEVESSCRVFSFTALTRRSNQTFNDQVNMVDDSFFSVFDFTLEEGNKHNPFATGNSIVITREAAKKYFGQSSALGQSLELLLGDKKVTFNVSAVMANPPAESSIRFDMLIPFIHASNFFSEKILAGSWSNVNLETYVLLREGATTEAADAKIPAVMQPLVSKNYKPGEYTIRLQPLTGIHLNNDLPEGNEPISNPMYSYILATIGVLILLIACINFITLSAGSSISRAMEVGVRKVLGAERGQLIRQYWTESLLLSFVSTITGIVLAFFLLKPFNRLAGKELTLGFDPFTLAFCAGLVILIGLIAGIYPAVVLSGFKPVKVLKGTARSGRGMSLFGKVLVTIQFVASIVMIIATMTIGRQLDYIRSKDLGFDKERVVIVPTNSGGEKGDMLAGRFKAALANNPDVVSSSTSLYSMAESGWITLGYTDDKNIFRSFSINKVDEDFIPAMGLEILAGRNFMKSNPADKSCIIVNEALVKEYGWKDPVGRTLPGKYRQKIIGVVRDFNFESLHTAIRPLVLATKLGDILAASSDVTASVAAEPRVSVRLRSGGTEKQVESMKASWKSIAEGQEFDLQFLDDALNAAYKQDQRLANMVKYAFFLSIFIACIGLYGLATLTVIQRTREIGIRKVLGAGNSSIMKLLSNDFAILVLIASVIAFPIAWWALHTWLLDFTFRIGIPVWVFIAGSLFTLLIALITVSLQAFKAALANPVKSLRTE